MKKESVSYLFFKKSYYWNKELTFFGSPVVAMKSSWSRRLGARWKLILLYLQKLKSLCKICSRVEGPCFYLSGIYLTTQTTYICHNIEISEVSWPSDQFFIGPPPPPRKGGDPSFLDSSPCFLNNSQTGWSNNLGLVSFWKYLRGEHGKLPKSGGGVL